MTDRKILAQQMEEAYAGAGGDIERWANLVNTHFYLYGIRDVVTKDPGSGEERVSHIGEYSFDADAEEHHEVWVNGVGVLSQLAVVEKANAWPIRVKLIKDGQRYKLLLRDDD